MRQSVSRALRRATYWKQVQHWYRRKPPVPRRRAWGSFADPDRSGTAPQTNRDQMTTKPPSSWRICARRSGGSTQAVANRHPMRIAAGRLVSYRRAPATRLPRPHASRVAGQQTRVRQWYEKTADTPLRILDLSGTKQRIKRGRTLEGRVSGTWSKTTHDRAYRSPGGADGQLTIEIEATWEVLSNPVWGRAVAPLP